MTNKGSQILDKTQVPDITLNFQSEDGGDKIRPVWAEIDLNAIKKNIEIIRSELSPKTAFLAMVKANAYGHGLVQVSKAAVDAKVDRLGVALVEEGIKLRQSGIKVPIQMVSEPPLEAVENVIAYGIIPSVYSAKFAKALNEVALRQNKIVKVHLKADTGMNRVGAPIDSVPDLYRLIKQLPNLFLEGIFTHFACADNLDDPFTKRQLLEFLKLKKIFSDIQIWHSANSAAALFLPESHLDMVRIGISLYGFEPATKPLPVKLEPALTLKTRISFLKDLKHGDGVSYGLTYIAKRPHRVATLPIGYGDGYSRLLSNKGQALVRGKKVKLVGRICMDQLLIELEDVDAYPGDEVVLIGRQGNEMITVEEIAFLLGTIKNEVVCMLNERVPRVYLD